MFVATFVNNVSIHIPLFPVRLGLDFAADAVAAAKAVRIAVTARQSHQLAGKCTYCRTLCVRPGTCVVT